MSGSSSLPTLTLLPISSYIRHRDNTPQDCAPPGFVSSARDLWENAPTSGKALPEFTLHYPSDRCSTGPMLMELPISFMRDSIFLIWSHTVSALFPISSTADSIPVLYQLGHLPDRHTNKCCKYHQLMQRAAPVPLLLLVWKDVRTFSESILTLKSKSVSVKFLCRAEDKYWTVVTMILQPKTKRRKQKRTFESGILHITVVGGAGFTTGTEKCILCVTSVIFTHKSLFLALMNNLY